MSLDSGTLPRESLAIGGEIDACCDLTTEPNNTKSHEHLLLLPLHQYTIIILRSPLAAPQKKGYFSASDHHIRSQLQ